MTVLDPKYHLYENFLRWPLGTLASFSEWTYSVGILEVITDPELNTKVSRYTVTATGNLVHNPANKIITQNRTSPWLIDIAFEQLPSTGHFVFGIRDSNGSLSIQLRVDSTGNLEIRNNVTWVQIIANLFVPNAWHTFEMGYNPTGSNWILSVDGKKFGPFVIPFSPTTFNLLEFFSDTNQNVSAKITNSYLKLYNAGLGVYELQDKGYLSDGSNPGFFKIAIECGPFGYQLSQGYIRVLRSFTGGPTYILGQEFNNSVNWSIYRGFSQTIHAQYIAAYDKVLGNNLGDWVYHNYTGGFSKISRYSGASWVAVPDPPQFERVLFFLQGIPNGYMGIITAFNPVPANPVTLIRSYTLNETTNLWVLRNTYTLTTGFIVNATYGVHWTGSMIRDSTSVYIFGIQDGTNTRWLVYDSGLNTFTSVLLQSGVQPTPDNACWVSGRDISGIFFTISLWDATLSQFKTFVMSWPIFNTLSARSLDSNKYQFSNISFYATINDKFAAIWLPINGLCRKLTPTPGYDIGDQLTPGNYPQFWLNEVSPSTGSKLIVRALIPEPVAASLELRVEATGKPSEAVLYTDPESLLYYKESYFYEFVDGFGLTSIIGRMFNPRSNTEKSISSIKFVGLDYEALQKYELDLARPLILNYVAPAINNTLFKSEDHLKFILNGNNVFIAAIPPIIPIGFQLIPERIFPCFLYAGTISSVSSPYKRNWQMPIQDIVKFMRHLEKRAIYYEPDGKVQMLNQPIATGIRWTYGHPQVAVISIDKVDMRISRSEVIGAKNNETQVRYVHIGNPAIEGTEGISFIKLQDSNILNHNEAVDLAINRFNIYTNPTKNYLTYFIKLRVKSQGFIQPGKTIDFEWDDGVRIVPRDNYLVIQVDPIDLKNDFSEMWLVNNIITYKEFMDVYKSIGRDGDSQGTSYDASKSSTTQGTITQQNPDNRLRSGTREERTPEATAYDFSRTALTTAPGWSTVNLSAIIPDGVRAVHIQVSYRSSSVAAFFLFRKFGNTGSFNGVGASVQSVNQPLQAYVSSAVSEDRKIDIFSSITQGNWINLDWVIVGWDI